MKTIWNVPHVRALLQMDVEQLQDGTVVYVSGYYEIGDGGCKHVVWRSTSVERDNGGTVHTPYGWENREGRYHILHQGVLDYRLFGVMGPETSADAALDAMLADPTVKRVEAFTNLSFTRRHRLSRSHIELDFLGHTVYSTGIEDAAPNDPFSAVWYFRGQETGVQQEAILTSDLMEFTDVLEVRDAAVFIVDEWWMVKVNRLSGNAERELEKLIQVTEIIDDTHVRFNYKLGWGLEAGRTITYQQIQPIVRANVRNMVFFGAGSTDVTGSHPLAYEFAVHCDVTGVEATGTFWPVIIRRYNTEYVTERCKLANPTEVVIGGTGYMTQQIHCLYGHVRDCLASNARHINDFTSSAYCYVDNCHADGSDEHGAYVTHGQYEHDLVYIGNSGLLSFGNSGPTWGDSAKRITVKKHVGPRLVAHKKITDLTLEDVHIHYIHGLLDAGTMWVNVDGLQMRNCSSAAMLTLSQRSARSKRPNVIENCSFQLKAGEELIQASVTADVKFDHCRFEGADANKLLGTGVVTFQQCEWSGSLTSRSIELSASRVAIHGGTMHNTGFALNGEGDQWIQVGAGLLVSGDNEDHAYFSSSNGTGIVTWQFQHYRSDAPHSEMRHYAITGGCNQYSAIGVLYSGGRFEAHEAAFCADLGCMFFHTSCVERKVERSLLGESPFVRHMEGNMFIK